MSHTPTTWVCNWHNIPSRNELLSSAYHESGHCCALLRFNVPFQHVHIHKGHGVTGQTIIHNYMTRDSCIIAALAGPMAQARYTGATCADIFKDGGRDDLQMAQDALCAAVPPVPDLNTLLAYAQALVDAEWAHIELIAYHLHHCRALTYNQVRSLIQYYG